jgi:hypothetical protein
MLPNPLPTKKMTNDILKVEIVSWVVFAIPAAFIGYGIYLVFDIASLQGHTPGFTVFISPAINLIAWFFASRCIVEYAKRKLHEKELERLQKLIHEEYPETLEDYESGESTP